MVSQQRRPFTMHTFAFVTLCDYNGSFICSWQGNCIEDMLMLRVEYLKFKDGTYFCYSATVTVTVTVPIALVKCFPCIVISRAKILVYVVGTVLIS